MAEDRDSPDAEDVVIWQMDERDSLDVYRLTRGETVLGEFTGRSIGSSVFRTAIEHLQPGRAVWLKDELGVRRLNPESRPPEAGQPQGGS